MYKLAIPIQNKSLNDKNRTQFVAECKRAGCERVFLTASLEENLEILKFNVQYFKDNGFEVGIWVGSTIGHGATLLNSRDTGEKPKYQRLVNLEGREMYGTNCPLDKSFQKYLSEQLAKLSECGTNLIMLDDDYRLSQHGASPCCACPLHMAKISKYCGEDITVEQLEKRAFSGKKNKYRDAWMKAQGESLEELAMAVRKEVDKVNPEASISACSAYCSWDLDGTDPIRLTNILAGNNKKHLRLHGAPYWASHNNKPIATVCEIARMFASFCSGEDIEIFSEGDAYPRPRFNTPASYVELHDAALRADGHHDGILKYMLDYTSVPLYETGYIDRHVRDLDKLESINVFFAQGANEGVRVLIKPHLIDDADLDMSPLRQQSPYPTAGMLLSMNSIPTVYLGDGICKALFGENARHFELTDFKEGAILDGVAAAILTERGVDVGLDSVGEWADNNIGVIFGNDTGFGKTAMNARVRRLCGNFKSNVRPVLSMNNSVDERTLAYRYENADGQRFLVFAFSADHLSSYPEFLRSYEVASALKSGIEWISGKQLPVSVKNAPELYILCERGEDYISVALLNCFLDCVLAPTVTLDREYPKIEFSGASGRIEGNKVIFDTDIPAFDFVVFKAYNH